MTAAVAPAAAEEQWRQFMAAVSSALILVRTDGQILLANPAATTLFGYRSNKELEGESFEKLIKNADGTHWKDQVRLAGVRKDGSAISLEMHWKVASTPWGDSLLATISEEPTLKKETPEEIEIQFRSLADALPEISWTATPDGRRDYYNKRWYAMTGTDSRLSDIEKWKELIHPDDRQLQAEVWKKSIDSNEPYEMENRLWDRERLEFRWHLARAMPVLSPDGRVSRWFGVCTDIQAHKTAEEQLRRIIVEKETLLREVHHRVKNNLQIICSLLRMQSLKLSDPMAANALRDSQLRVLSMALVHERLIGCQNVANVDFGEYTTTLAAELFHSYALPNVTRKISAEPVMLDIDQAIPCGLILNELITNGLKHAYAVDASGELTIVLSISASNRVGLTVSDRGTGLPENFEVNECKSIGLSIVSMLAEQLHGQLEIRRLQPGVEFSVIFPKGIKKETN